MRINWLQDMDIFQYPGGAELNDAAHFATGLRREHDIRLLGPSSPFFKADLLIVSNCVTFDTNRLKDMTNSIPTVYFLHDYLFCKYRLHYPMVPMCGSCDGSKYWLERYLKAKLLIFLSPLHREATLGALPELEDIKYALVPSAINPSEFLCASNDRLNKYLSVNGLAPFKGRDNLIKFAKDNRDAQIDIVYPEQVEGLPGNISIIPPTTYNEMPALYRKYKYYIELPETPQPFNRTVVEAKLSGCEVITNKLMGAASWDWFKEDPETIAIHLLDALKTFWDAIEEAVK